MLRRTRHRRTAIDVGHEAGTAEVAAIGTVPHIVFFGLEHGARSQLRPEVGWLHRNEAGGKKSNFE